MPGFIGFILDADQELLGLVEAPLEDTDLGEACGRGAAAGTLARLGELADRRDELLLGGVDPAVRGEDVGAARAAESEQRDVVVSPHELLKNLAPLLGPLRIARALTREHQSAADVGERLEPRRLPTCRRSHGLVEPREPVVHAPSETSASPSWASARSSRSVSPALSATSSAPLRGALTHRSRVRSERAK